MNITDTELLHKIINLQSCIIQGRNINAMLHKDKKFYQEVTDASFIAIYVNENERVNLEYILEDHHQFHSLAQKYIFSNTHLNWDNFTQNCRNHFSSNMKYHHTDNLYELFKGLIPKKNATELANNLDLKDIITMPLYTFDGKQEIGYICFMFQKKVDIKIKKLEEIKRIFETLLQPLHDNNYNILYTKCIRIDEDFKLLTEQEKRIVKQVLNAKSYPQISASLNLSINTVKSHMKNIFNKYQVNSKLELYRKLNGIS